MRLRKTELRAFIILVFLLKDEAVQIQRPHRAFELASVLRCAVFLPAFDRGNCSRASCFRQYLRRRSCTSRAMCTEETLIALWVTVGCTCLAVWTALYLATAAAMAWLELSTLRCGPYFLLTICLL